MTADKLRKKYEWDLKKLQEKCPHEVAHWMREEWAPAHGTGSLVAVCANCHKTIDRQPGSLILGSVLYVKGKDAYDRS
jgi:hypothetical protein